MRAVSKQQAQQWRLRTALARQRGFIINPYAFGASGFTNPISRNWNDGLTTNQTLFGAGSPSHSAASNAYILTPTGGTGEVGSRFDGVTSFQDGEFSVTISDLTASKLGGIVFRQGAWASADGEYAYLLYISDGGIALNKGKNGTGAGSPAGLGSVLTSVGVSNVLKFYVDGADITAAVGSAELMLRDATFSAAGGIGLYAIGGAITFDNFTADWTTPYTDANYANVVSRLKFDGSNGSTTFTDEKSKTWTASGGAQIATAQFRFGGASLRVDGTGDYISTPDHADFDFGSGDFTVEGWLRADTTSGTGVVIAKHASGTGPFMVYRNGTTLELYASSNGTTWNLVSAAALGTISTNTWYHWAICRSGTNIRAFLNGVVGSTTGVSTSALVSNSTAVTIGSWSGAALEFAGYIDDVRITKGVGRYTAAFTRPRRPFPVV